MANIELVIKIPEERYKNIVKQVDKRDYPDMNTGKAIANGIVLPKGHGDLKDADKLKHAFIKWSMAVQGFFNDSDISSIVYNSPTIVEAESEDE